MKRLPPEGVWLIELKMPHAATIAPCTYCVGFKENSPAPGYVCHELPTCNDNGNWVNAELFARYVAEVKFE